MKVIARYTVLFERYLGDEDWPHEEVEATPEMAIQQLRVELQGCCDDLGLPAGRFNIMKREEITEAESFLHDTTEATPEMEAAEWFMALPN